MRLWLHANGGPLALVVVGVGVGGFTNTYVGIALIVIGVVWFAWSHLSQKPTTSTDTQVVRTPRDEVQALLGHGKALRAAIPPPPKENFLHFSGLVTQIETGPRLVRQISDWEGRVAVVLRRVAPEEAPLFRGGRGSQGMRFRQLAEYMDQRLEELHAIAERL